MTQREESQSVTLGEFLEQVQREVADWPPGFLDPVPGTDPAWERVMQPGTSENENH